MGLWLWRAPDETHPGRGHTRRARNHSPKPLQCQPHQRATFTYQTNNHRSFDLARSSRRSRRSCRFALHLHHASRRRRAGSHPPVQPQHDVLEAQDLRTMMLFKPRIKSLSNPGTPPRLCASPALTLANHSRSADYSPRCWCPPSDHFACSHPHVALRVTCTRTCLSSGYCRCK